MNTQERHQNQLSEFGRTTSDLLLLGIGVLSLAEAGLSLLQGEVGMATVWAFPALACLWLAGHDLYQMKNEPKPLAPITTAHLIPTPAGD
jgi:hypothetical protein